MGGSTTTQQSGSSQSINEIPQWVQNAGQANYGYAQNIATQPLQQYQGQMVADTAPQTQQAWNLAANSGNVGQNSQNAAQAGYLNTLGSAPQSINAAQGNAAQAPTGRLANTNLSPYMNPYTQSVINTTLPIMQQNLMQNQNQMANAAASANAFGGDRQAIQQGVTQAQGAMGMGQMAAGLNQANFAQAQQAGMFDVGQANQMGQFNAGQANQMGQFNAAARNAAAAQNQQAGLTQEQLGNAASAGLGQLGTQQMQNNIANYGMLTSAGGFEQAQAQNDINAQLAKFQQANTYPLQGLGVLESSLGQTPYNTGTSGSSQSTTQQTQSNPMAMALGGLSTLGGLFSAPAGGISAASGIQNFFGGSDRRMKTDITRVGTHRTGIPIHAYRYKGDPKTYPKVVGPMAEDVAKIAPHAVSIIPGSGGRRAVHMPTLNALGAGALPPSSPGVATAIGMLRPSATPGVLSPNATPPSRGILSGARKPRVPTLGALGG
jgi:hypothetical protein